MITIICTIPHFRGWSRVVSNQGHRYEALCYDRILAQITQHSPALGNLVASKRLDLAYNQTSQLTNITRWNGRNIIDTSQDGYGNGITTLIAAVYTTYARDALGRITLVAHRVLTPDSAHTITHYYNRDELGRVSYQGDGFATGTASQILTSSAYSYSPTVGTTTTMSEFYIFDGQQIVATLDANGAMKTRYLWGPETDQFLAEEYVQAARR